MVNRCRVLKTRAPMPIGEIGVEMQDRERKRGITQIGRSVRPKFGETPFESEVMSCVREGEALRKTKKL